MSFPEYSNFDGLGLAALVREKKISARELVDEAIERIERVNPQLNAVVRILADEAHASAAAASDTPGEGPFASVPFLLKDAQAAYAGVPLCEGARVLRDFVPRVDAELVRRHKQAGLIVVGKTNLPEFALRPVCEPAWMGPTHTPWKLGHTSGGSSGGSAAAVAAGIVPMAHGADGGGSLRIPAACCGVFGFKPSRGRMPSGPDCSELWLGYAVEHAITRSVRDSAALLDATLGAQPGDAYQLPAPVRPFLDEVATPPAKLRVGFSKRPFMLATVHPDCVAAVERTAKRLSDLGHIVEEADMDVDAMAFGRDFFLLACMGAAMSLDEAGARIGRKIRRRDVETATWLCAAMARQASAVTWTRARTRLNEISRRVATRFEHIDVLLTPTLASPPVAIGALEPPAVERAFQAVVASLHLEVILRLPGVVDSTVRKVFSFMPFTALANVTGQPCMSLPLDWNKDGLPIGSMIMGRLGDEATLFRLAGQLEQAHPWSARKPPIYSGD
jgi:amidase